MNNPKIKINHVATVQQSMDALSDEDRGKVSDGYHTYNELYTFRKLYNALIVNEIQNQIDLQQEVRVQNDTSKNLKGGNTIVGKSIRHHDGELCFGGDWFVVYIQYSNKFNESLTITNHYHMDDWDLFQIPISDRGPLYDGHTTQDVIERLNELIKLRTKDRELEDYVAIVDNDYNAFANGGDLDDEVIDTILSEPERNYDDYRGGNQWAN